MGTTADKLNKLLETKSDIKTAIEAKGVSVGDIPFSSYAEKVGEISGGGGIPNYIAPKNNVNGVYQPDNTATSFSLNGATKTTDYSLAYAFYNCTNLTSADLSSLTTVLGFNAMNNCFNNCTGLISVDISSLTIVSGFSSMSYCFRKCTGLTSVNLPYFTTIDASSGMSYCFDECVNLVSVNLPNLTTITGNTAFTYCFSKCTALKELRFPAITTTSFGTSYKNQFSNMCSRCTDIVLHFPSNVESVIRGLQGYSDTQPFGATSGQVLFDLPSTEI